MSDVTQWLKQLGLGQYARSFEENDIDRALLSELTDTDLMALGVTSLGHRKRILVASKKLATGDGAGSEFGAPDLEGQATENQDTAAESSPWLRTPGERKPVTMLFADVVGSTSLTETLDAEDAHELLEGATQRMCSAIEHNRGTVCRFMGDGVMSVFGAPVAYERHAVNACEAALAMRSAIREYSDEVESRFGRRIGIRVGLHAGEVVVVRVGDESNPGYDASGPTVPLAARMEQTAAPDTIQLTASTFELVRDRFEGQPLVPVDAKGFADPVPVVRLEGRRDRLSDVITEERPFIGRRTELAQIRAALDVCAEEGLGQTAIVRGEAGIGKTRLAGQAELIAVERGFQVHRSQVLDFGAAKGQDAARSLVRSFLGLDWSSTAEQCGNATESAIEAGRVPKSHRPHLNDLLNLPQPLALRAEYEALDDRTRTRQRIDLVAALLERLASERPQLVVVEDVHWADPPILLYLARLIRAVSESRSVVLLTTRIEGDPTVGTLRGGIEGIPLLTVDVGPLNVRDAEALAGNFSGVEGELLRACIERSGRNPLFLEHLLRSAAEGSATLPTSVQSLVATRIDRLSREDKQAIQAASVLGQRFDKDALTALVDDPGYDCAPLIEAHLVRADAGRFLFSHALVQEGVYSSLLKRERTALHERAAAWFRERDPTLYAQHLDRAEHPGAAEAYCRAAEAQAAAFHFRSATGLAARGLEIAPDDEVRAKLHWVNGNVQKGRGETRLAIEAYERAASLTGDVKTRCRAMIGMGHCLRDLGEYERGIEVLERAEREAVSGELVAERAEIHFHRGNIRYLLHDREGCLKEHQQSLELARLAGSSELEAQAYGGLCRASLLRSRPLTGLTYLRDHCLPICERDGLDHVKNTYIHMLGNIAFFELRFDDALEHYTQCIENGPRVGAHRAAIIAHCMAGELNLIRGAYDAVRGHSEESERLAELTGERRYLSWARCNIGLLVAAEDRREDAEQYLEKAFAQCDESDMGWNGLRLLGAIALVAQTEDRRQWALKKGEAVIAGPCNGQGECRFLFDAIHSALDASEWEDAERYADLLEGRTAEEPIPLYTFYTREARALSSLGRGARSPELRDEIQDLAEQAREIGIDGSARRLESAIANS